MNYKHCPVVGVGGQDGGIRGRTATEQSRVWSRVQCGNSSGGYIHARSSSLLHVVSHCKDISPALTLRPRIGAPPRVIPYEHYVTPPLPSLLPTKKKNHLPPHKLSNCPTTTKWPTTQEEPAKPPPLPPQRNAPTRPPPRPSPPQTNMRGPPRPQSPTRCGRLRSTTSRPCTCSRVYGARCCTGLGPGSRSGDCGSCSEVCCGCPAVFF